MVFRLDPSWTEPPRPLFPQRSLEQEWQWKSLERGFFETGSMVTAHATGWALCVTPDLGTGSPSSGSGDPHTD